MFYALVHYPSIDIKRINQFRRKYDPHVALINPHITFVFLVPESVGENNLISHIESVLNHWQPFAIQLKGLHKAWDQWLFLILAEGNERVTDIEFVPHLGISG